MESIFIKREAADGEFYAELEILTGDTVGRLAARACAEYGWGASSRARLLLVKRGGKLPTRTEESSSTPLDDPSDALASAGVAPARRR